MKEPVRRRLELRRRNLAVYEHEASVGDNTGRSGYHGWPNISQLIGPDVIYNPDAPLQNKQVGSLMHSYCIQSILVTI